MLMTNIVLVLIVIVLFIHSYKISNLRDSLEDKVGWYKFNNFREKVEEGLINHRDSVRVFAKHFGFKFDTKKEVVSEEIDTGEVELVKIKKEKKNVK